MLFRSGRIAGVNRAAARVLCQPRSALLGRSFSELFDRRLQSLFTRPAGQRADLVEMMTQLGLQVQARFESAPRHADADRLPVAGVATPGVLGADLDASATALSRQPSNMRELERLAIERTLMAFEGNVSAAARQLGISRNTIYRRRGESTV